jgi:hypothetical protein
MASIKRRTRSDGTMAFRVVWREGGTRNGAWQSETLYTARDAAIEAALSGRQIATSASGPVVPAAEYDVE